MALSACAPTLAELPLIVCAARVNAADVARGESVAFSSAMRFGVSST